MQNAELMGENFCPAQRVTVFTNENIALFHATSGSSSAVQSSKRSVDSLPSGTEVKNQAMMVLSTIRPINHWHNGTNQQFKGPSRLWIATVVPVY
ncbi:hypothetical protein ABK905_21235 [Acerihabitans sp. KWT182]|uniref:Uncharacterized protein n=1 Tax=Acerihabitans sp. KWT182 TaxID=3157919 RepID=A0AAU7Q7S2_9GAMM